MKVKATTACPLCLRTMSVKPDATWSYRRKHYASHVRAVHVELNVRERSEVADEMMLSEVMPATVVLVAA